MALPLPIIAMTAQALPEQIADCLAAGMNITSPSLRREPQMMAVGRRWPGSRARAPHATSAGGRKRASLNARAPIRAHPRARCRDRSQNRRHRAAGTAGSLGMALPVKRRCARPKN
jgi:hypothetical protein